MSWGGSEKNRWFQLGVLISMFWSSSGECMVLPQTFYIVFPPCKVSNPTYSKTVPLLKSSCQLFIYFSCRNMKLAFPFWHNTILVIPLRCRLYDLCCHSLWSQYSPVTVFIHLDPSLFAHDNTLYYRTNTLFTPVFTLGFGFPIGIGWREKN